MLFRSRSFDFMSVLHFDPLLDFENLEKIVSLDLLSGDVRFESRLLEKGFGLPERHKLASCFSIFSKNSPLLNYNYGPAQL